MVTTARGPHGDLRFQPQPVILGHKDVPLPSAPDRDCWTRGGVAHGFRAIGTDPAILVYMTDRFYDQADEGRTPYDHGGINYDLETQHK